MPFTIDEGDPIRLYTQSEIRTLWKSRSMRLDEVFARFTETSASPDGMQMVVFSTKL